MEKLGNTISHTIEGTLTMNTTLGNNSTLDFTGSTANSVEVKGTLNLNGTDATGQALVTGGLGNEINLHFTSGGTGDGLFNGNFFTISFPVANGVHVNTATEPTIDNGTFQNPISGGILLNLNNATVLPTTLNNLTFNGTPA